MPDDIAQWLDDLGLGKYAELFAENAIDRSLLIELDDADLEKIGVGPLGHRKLLLKAIGELRANGRHPVNVADDLTGVHASPEVHPTPADAERRQLTVMFCDMVGSTALSTRTDPEDYREIVRAYQDTCAGVVTRFGGYVAQFMGDGVLAYFGWPRAHEDDAVRAIGAALELVDTVGALPGPNGEDRPIAMRIGIATGPVVIGDIIGEGSAQEAAATGETLNLASRLQTLADANSVVISAETRALAGGLFDYEGLGPQTLKGIEGAPEVWRVIGERHVESRFAAAHGGELTPLIGREEELELLLRRWQRAKDGDGQVVLLAGEPGIGKSRLVRALRDAIADEPLARLVYQCSPHHSNSALYPIIRQIEHAAGFETGDAADARLDKLERLLAQAGRPTAEIMPLFASLLSIPASERHPLPDLTPQQLKERTLAALVDQLVGIAEQKPVLFALEDAHWIDPTSLELMELVTGRIRNLPVLAIVTYRPDFTAPWVGLPDVALLALSRLNARACTAMAERLTGGFGLSPEVMAQLVAKTDGVPLFIEELTRSVVEARAQARPVETSAPTGQAAEIVVPATLQEALGARLDRSPAVREVAQIGAAIGREFPYDVLAHVVSFTQADLNAALDDLVASGLVFARGTPPEATYAFKHSLVQDTAYDSMVRGKRHDIHKHIAEALLKLRPEMADTEPAVLAHHATEAGMLDEAIDWWTGAGQIASARSANPEAVELLERGLALISRLPESEARDRRELALQTALFGPLIAVKGQAAAELELAFNRTLELCDRVSAPEEMFRALFAKSLSHFIRGQLALSHQVAEDLLQRSQRASNEGAELTAHRMVGMSQFYMGRIVEAQTQFQLVRSTFDRGRHGKVMLTYGQDPALICAMYEGWAQWILGFPHKARVTQERVLAEALELDHVSTLGAVLNIAIATTTISRDTDGARRIGSYTSGMKLHEAFRQALRPLVEGMTNPSLRSATALRDALVHLEIQAIARVTIPDWWGKFLAENYLAIGDVANALEANERGFQLAEQQGDHWSASERLRVRGLALAMRDGVEGNVEAEDCLRRAVDDARARSAKSFELRSAMSLARFLRDQGRSAEAREMLSPIYAWFTEGFDTPDLIDARALLDELS